jgi:hypothetical protein
MSPSEVAALLASHQLLEASHEKLEGEVVELKRQLNWFKKQLFGSKSERRLIDLSPDQLSLGEGLRPAANGSTGPVQQIPAHTRRRRAPGTDDDTTIPRERALRPTRSR